MKTSFAKHTNPWTGERDGGFTDIPTRPSKGKGTTKYDDIFNELLKMKRAYEVHIDEFEQHRRAAKRFVEFNNLSSVCIRQQKDSRTNTYKIWFEKK